MKKLVEEIKKFRAERDWDQFHSPKNLVMALMVECAELAEHFQWLTQEQSKNLPAEKRNAVKEEMGDVLVYLVNLAERLNIDLLKAATEKVEKNKKKYPANKVKGKSLKYDAYTPKKAADELVVIVDEQNQIIGSATRSIMRRFNLIHRATYILLFNSKNQLFVHQRTQTKDIFPGYYDIAAGGVVLAGEEYDLSAERELEEELGIFGVPLQPLFEFCWGEESNKVWGKAYICISDGPVTLQEEEVQWGRFMDIEEVVNLRASQPFTPDGLYLLDRYLAEVTSVKEKDIKRL